MKKLVFFPYIGGKSLIANTIIKLIPEHTVYVEPFGGSAKVLLNKPPSKIEIYNDADLRLANLFYVVAFKFKEFEEKVSRLVYSRALYKKFLKDVRLKELKIEKLGDVDLAIKTYVVLYYSFNSNFKTQALNVSYKQNKAVSFFNNLQRLELIHNRLKNVVIEYLSYDKILEKYLGRDDAFIYLDPPYFRLEHYYDVKFTIEDHKKMLDMLKSAKAKWLLSGYDNELYNTELKDFYRLEIPTFKPSYGITKNSKLDKRPQAIEILWANYDLYNLLNKVIK
ncbi:MAG: DNA adenine methylase [Sulfurihydrogenibium sp.]|jgi:DNA adenine methylase|nr:DNA adenine methylase [Sulfurihydrogenibium sp.]